MKKSYAIELTNEDEKLLKDWFNCKTDGELRNALQKTAEVLINKLRRKS